MCDSVQPHRWQPTRVCRPWDSPGKNTGVGCHFLLQCMKMKSESEVAQSCLTLSDPMDCSLPGSSVPGIFQARVLEWGAIDETCPINCLVLWHVPFLSMEATAFLTSASSINSAQLLSFCITHLAFSIENMAPDFKVRTFCPLFPI